ncbi:uncharacterized protein CIMG_12691 [Coccidioides immitis RS]|uniref:Uncharacterized protein n=1 Tax=Coccidioides immitis (strain RS) TaxID=246410 RepID=J3KL83_COCIM|nr:uncharacterized protein CIMG_12691 [Coccidioides immitis RS]EAS37014.3 hypothetical protein CIMG_12691 [Coccidioides immitis RS]
MASSYPHKGSQANPYSCKGVRGRILTNGVHQGSWCGLRCRGEHEKNRWIELDPTQAALGRMRKLFSICSDWSLPVRECSALQHQNPTQKPEKNAGEYSGTPSLRQNSANAIPSIKAHRRKASQDRARLTNLAPDYRVAEPSTGQGGSAPVKQRNRSSWRLGSLVTLGPANHRCVGVERTDEQTQPIPALDMDGWMDGGARRVSAWSQSSGRYCTVDVEVKSNLFQLRASREHLTH